MKLHNTRTRQIEPFTPIKPRHADVYTCGPTVYDYSHIGHWFTYVRADLLVRVLKANGYKVQWIMNITDVGHLVSDADEGEDKLEKGAKREGKTAWQVAEFYTKDFTAGLKALNITPPAKLVKATDHINEQVALIQILEAKGFTYVIDDGVYYDTSKFPTYANFAQLDLADQKAGARVQFNPQKRHSSDFALWKFSPKSEKRDMEWQSPWGKGFPGWHIECSAMSMKYLGQSFDIHTGGVDHIPVHHTNEIAQSEAATEKRFVNYWLHSNHVSVDGEKISKSLGNGIRLQDIAAKGYTPEDLRLLILESHYRSQAKFSWQSLAAAKNRLNEYRAMAALRWQTRDVVYDAGTFTLEEVPVLLREVLDHDLNTPEALALLSRVATQLLTVLLEKDMRDHFEKMLSAIDDLLGLKLSQEPDITQDQKKLIAAREQARQNKDWTEADRLRDTLQSQKIGLRDTEAGVIWFPL